MNKMYCEEIDCCEHCRFKEVYHRNNREVNVTFCEYFDNKKRYIEEPKSIPTFCPLPDYNNFMQEREVKQ